MYFPVSIQDIISMDKDHRFFFLYRIASMREIRKIKDYSNLQTKQMKCELAKTEF